MRLHFRTTLLATSFAILSNAFGGQVSIGPDGINSAGLPLTGAGIAIGQVESGRPGRPMNPNMDSATEFHPDVKPTAVFIRDSAMVPVDANTTDHAVQVAGILISTESSEPGVSPGASLYSSAVDPMGPSLQPLVAISLQYVALQNAGDVRAINLSYGLAVPGAMLDGNSTLSQFIDWSSQAHETLYVVAGDESPTLPIPTDNFNGITVAESLRINGMGKYRQASTQNLFNSAPNGRTLVDLMAPGIDVITTFPGNTVGQVDGTSFAAPHVTGTVAILQEYADSRIAQSIPGWDADARHRQVMKAVIMNSADKLEDSGDGLRLGMQRTALKSNGTSTWLNSDAYNSTSSFDPADQIPLDLEMGTGHLNANRAFQQFSGGETNTTPPTIPEPSTIVPQVGWDWANTDETGGFYNNYEFGESLPQNSFVSITLTWERQLTLATDGGVTGAYDSGDTFEVAGDFDEGFNDLNLYLLPEGASDINEAVAQSIATGWNVEHIFWQIPVAGKYEFWVYEADSPLGLGTDYAVAWWAYEGPPGPVLFGDYDGSGTVDADDYTLWKNAFGGSVTPGTGADGNGDGIINLADYTVWRDNLGATSALSTQAVPEPSSVVPCLLLTLGWYSSNRLRDHV